MLSTLQALQLKRHFVTIDGYADVPPKNEKLLLQAVASQPVSVGISGGERAFQLYSEVGNYHPLSKEWVDNFGLLTFSNE